MKRANGMGSVYKLSGKRRKPYAVAVTVNGKQTVINTFAKPRQAIEFLDSYLSNPYNVDNSKLTVLELFEKWIPTYNKSQSSKNNYKTAFYVHSKSLHSRIFATLRKQDIQNLIDECNLSYTSKSYIKIVFTTLFKYAEEIELGVKKNYAKDVYIGSKSESNLHKNISDKDLEAINKNSNNYFIDIILVYIYTGARTNELLTLKKENVFLEDNYLKTGSKTKAGKDRIIPIHSKIKAIIKKHYKSTETYLFELTKGKRISYKAFKKNFDKSLNNLDLEEIYIPYDTRHTFATLAKLHGMDDLCRKLIMGHAISDLTDNTYTHIPIQKLIEEVEKLK